MKNRIFLKAVSLTAAAALGCSGWLGTGIMPAAAATAEADAKVIAPESYSEPVQFIVKVEGDAALNMPDAAGMGSDFLETPEAVAQVQAIESVQEIVQREIRELYPELEVGYSYSVLCNGFSCKFPPELADAVRALPNVKGVSRVKKLPAPQMASAKSLGAVDAYYDATGCYGEGKVVAVIDTELDVTHPMFAALDDSIETTVTKEDIAEVASSEIGLNVDIDPNQAYRSNKLPFVVDYHDPDPYGDITSDDPETYHGTHVAGIAAGNAFVDADGKEISGIAKNAQILFFGIGIDGQRYIDTTAAFAAAEDAVKLHADVINMSYGGYTELFENEDDSIYTDLYKAAENAGIVICKSAGNADDGSLEFGYINKAENPDTGMLCDEPADSPVLTVASADNNSTELHMYLLHNGEKIPYSSVYGGDEVGAVLTGELSYEYCGLGYAEDFEGKDLTGKIALIRRGEFTFEEKAQNAKDAGAVCAVFINHPGEALFTPSMNNIPIPSCLIGYAEGEAILADESGTITLVNDYMEVPYETAVSSYTSWGVKQSLKMEPDIMGIGGRVESAAYGSSTELMNGTSMASPYLAGCTAVMCEYMDKMGLELTGAEKVAYIRNLLMNSAVPYVENGMYVTPRRQGAGLVNLNNMMSDKVIMTNDENQAKINLFDKIENSFTFNVNLTNLSDEDVAFTDAKLVLTTQDAEYIEEYDGVHSGYLISGQQALSSEAELSGLLNVAAGENRTEQISVSLDAAQLDSIAEVFVNGFFVEGYLLLSGAENCCDISVPVLGFRGDWGAVPIFDEANSAAVAAMGMYSAADCSMSLSNVTAALIPIMQQIPQEVLENAQPEEFLSLIYSYATEEQLAQMYTLNDTFYISPNGDGLADVFGINQSNYRAYIGGGLDVYDAKGNLIAEGEKLVTPIRYDFFTAEQAFTLNTLEDGEYTAVLHGHIDYPGAEDQSFVTPFTVDTKAPEMSSKVIEKDGRTILRVTVKDQALDGIFVTGNGNGGIVGEYDPANPGEPTLDAIYNAATAVLMVMNGGGSSFVARDYNTDELPVLGKLLTSENTERDFSGLNFSDLIVAEPDEKGSFTFEYDITDMSSYSFTAVDKAYNLSTIESEPEDAVELPEGLYAGPDGFYYFGYGDIGPAIWLKKYEVKKYEDVDVGYYTDSYTFENGKLKLDWGDDEKVGTVKQINEDTYRVIFDDETLTLRYRQTTEGNWGFYTTNQVENRIRTLLASEMPEMEITNLTTRVDMDGVAHFSINGSANDAPRLITGTVDLLTGDAFSPQLGMISMYPIRFTELPEGVWKVYGDDWWKTEDRKVLEFWNIDHRGEGGDFFEEVYGDLDARVQADDAAWGIDFHTYNTRFVLSDVVGFEYSILNDHQVVLTINSGVEGLDGRVLYLEYTGAENFDTLNYFNNAELAELALAYYGDKKLTADDVTFEVMTETGTVKITLGDNLESYDVDVLTGIGKDSKGKAVDLTASLPAMEDPFGSSVWYNYDSFFIFSGDGTGKTQSIENGEGVNFTYEMTHDGAVFTFENGLTLRAALFPQEDGTVKMNWLGADTVTLHRRADADPKTFTFIPAENLKNMAELHSPLIVASTDYSFNEDGMVKITLRDETGAEIGSYTVDPATGCGVDENGKEQNLSYVFEPELPEGAYTREELEKMAIRDYEVRKGVKPAEAGTFVRKDGTVLITLFDENGEDIDCYTVDPVTGQGTDDNGEAVDLPQTGNNAPAAAATASGAALLLLAGAVMMLRSGVLRRKQDAENA